MSTSQRMAILEKRGVLRITGDDARKLLDGILTCDLDKVDAKTARLGALLSPQGKILFDFLIVGSPEAETPGFYLDCPGASAADFAKRLGFYKLRAKMTIEDVSDRYHVVAGWGGLSPQAEAGIVFADPRLPALGWRAICSKSALPADNEESYRVHRIALGVPDTAEDFGYGDVFPHEMMMGELHGVDFDKGCYVGQEVVSRMQHRGTARTRIMIAAFEGEAPLKGSEVTAGGKVLGRLGSIGEGAAIALIRIDRASEALVNGHPIMAGTRLLNLEKPAYARFDFPIAAAETATTP